MNKRSRKKWSKTMVSMILMLFAICIILLVIKVEYFPSDFMKKIKETISTLTGNKDDNESKKDQDGTEKGKDGADSAESAANGDIKGEWKSDERNMTMKFKENGKGSVTMADIISIPIDFKYTLSGETEVTIKVSKAVLSMAKMALGDDIDKLELVGPDGSASFTYSVKDKKLSLIEEQSGASIELNQVQ